MSEVASGGEHLRDKRLLVTGATGFLGRHLCATLVKAGAEVLGASRHVDSSFGILNVRLVKLDVTSSTACDELVARERPQTVFHLASIVQGTREVDQVEPMLHANVLGTVNMLEAVEKYGGRFVQVGSQEQPIEFDKAPSSPYAASKAAARIYCQLFAFLYGVPVGIARVFMVYGPGYQDERKLIPYVIRALQAGEQPRLMSGVRRIDWIHVRDVVEGLLALDATLARRCVSGIQPELLEVDLGTGSLTSVRDVIAELYRQVAPDRRPIFGIIKDRAGEIEAVADIETAARSIGWRPRVALRDGLADTVGGFLNTDI